jgi:hypothetical protein
VTPELVVRYVSAALVRNMIGIDSIRAMDLKIVDEYNLVRARGDGEIGEAFWGCFAFTRVHLVPLLLLPRCCHTRPKHQRAKAAVSVCPFMDER